MAFDGLLVKEIFYSLQGETSQTGIPFTFVRLSGCNLRCHYCDTSYAFKGGDRLRIYEVINKIKNHPTKNVLLTGGEPLLQRHSGALVRALIEEDYEVSIETHGEVSIEAVAPYARIIMDIKTPSSGMCREGFIQNLPFLKKEKDEVKFVIASKEDYEWAKEILKTHSIQSKEILFSPALPTPRAPGTFTGVDARWLADQILKDQLPVRFQLQLHKLLWSDEPGH